MDPPLSDIRFRYDVIY